MSRRIVTTQAQAVVAAAPDGYVDRLLKYIPMDIVAAWTAVSGGIMSADERVPKEALFWACFAIGLVITPIWTLRMTRAAGKPPAVTQTILSTVAFAVWVFALGGPFSFQSWYSPAYGSLVLVAFSLLVPLVNPPEG